MQTIARWVLLNMILQRTKCADDSNHNQMESYWNGLHQYNADWHQHFVVMMAIWTATNWWYLTDITDMAVRAIHRSPMDFPPKDPVRRRCSVLFVISLNKLLNKLPSCRWFETPWCLCDTTAMHEINVFKLSLGLQVVVFGNSWATQK